MSDVECKLIYSRVLLGRDRRLGGRRGAGLEVCRREEAGDAAARYRRGRGGGNLVGMETREGEKGGRKKK